MLAVAVELGVIREILGRLENEVEDLKGTVTTRMVDLEGKVGGHATQMDRWRTTGKVLAALLISLGAGLGWLADRVMIWLNPGLGR
jgi:hypothetical protein